jgi:hypothetical protein
VIDETHPCTLFLGYPVWTTKKLLIWGKTYPEFSKSYYETVCTGAVDEETGKLVRIYPVTLRHMKEPFKTYDWIEAHVEKMPERWKCAVARCKDIEHMRSQPSRAMGRTSSVTLPPRRAFVGA